jgi:hypothetical protein
MPYCLHRSRTNSPRSLPIMEQYQIDMEGAQAQSPSTSASSSTLSFDLETEKEEVPANESTEAMQEPDIERPNMSQRSTTMKPVSSQSNIVEFDGPDDPENPKNWSTRRKWAVTGGMGGMTFVVTFASSVFVRLSFSHSHLILAHTRPAG